MSEINYIAHHGVKGMRWGIRRYQRPNGSRTPLGERHQLKLNRKYDDSSDSAKRSSGKDDNDSTTEKKGLTDKQKKAIKVGAAVVGTALAAYGTYKLASYMQDKRTQAAMQKANDYINSNGYRLVKDIAFTDGTKEMTFVNGAGNQIVTKGSRNQVGKAVGKRNAEVVAKAKRIYEDSTNTKLDRGLSKIVNAGDAAKNTATSVGNTVKRTATSVGNTAKRTATKAKNSILDTVNPIYEYTPKTTSSVTRTIDGDKYIETVTELHKKRVRRS